MMVNERNSGTASIRRVGGWQAWTRVIGIVAVIAASLAGPLVQRSSVTHAAGAIVTLVGSTTNIRPTDPVPTLTKNANISAAQNEFESFQIVVQAGDTAITGFSAQASDLIQQGVGTILNSNITLYREAYYNVTTPSRNGATGPWPDALIPDKDPYYGQKRNALPVTVEAGQKVVLWVDVLVPNPQAAGLYQGTINLTSTNGFADSVNVNLSVLNFALPSTSTLTSAFMTQHVGYSSICKGHYSADWACGGDSTKAWALYSLYARAALENRITIGNPWALYHFAMVIAH